MTPAELLRMAKERVLLCDGAMGTQLFAAGLAVGACGELWNIERPNDVEAIQRRYREAGCDLITTNTFCGSMESLKRHGLAERAAELNRAGAEVARRAAGKGARVMGDIGPFGGFLEPLGEMTPDRLHEVFRRQAEALHAGGVDLFIIETMTDPAEMTVAIGAAKEAAEIAVIATYAFDKAGETDFRTMMGATVDAALQAAIDAGADVVGANCGTSLGLEDYARLAQRLVAAADGVPVILQPNAGSPEMVDGKTVHPATPADMAALVPRLLEAGVRLFGGCCGTTPDHLRAMAEALRDA